ERSADALGRRAAGRSPRRERALRRDLLERRRREARVIRSQLVEREAGQILFGRKAVANDAANDLVRLPEWHTVPREVIGEVGGAEHALLGRALHRVAIE